MTAVHH